MSIALLLMSHGDFARAAMESAELIVGKQENYATLSVFTVDNLDSLRTEMQAKINTLNTEQGLLILTDIVGGTPSNLAIPLLSKENIQLGIGFNLPVLLEVCMNRDQSLDALIQIAKETYQDGFIQKSKQDFLTKENEDDDLL